MKKIIISTILVTSLLNAVSFPIDAYDCSRSAKKLKNYADDLESQESTVESAESDYELNCGSYGSYSRDESMCGTYGLYRTSYDNAISEYNSILSDIQYSLKNTLRSCQ